MPARTATRTRAPRVEGPTEHIAPKRGFIRLLCTQDYQHGHRLQIAKRFAEDWGDDMDFDRKDIAAAVTNYKAGQEYLVEASQAIRLLKDLGPARYRDAIEGKVKRRPDHLIRFTWVDRREVDDYLDELQDAIEDRAEGIIDYDVKDEAAEAQLEGELE